MVCLRRGGGSEGVDIRLSLCFREFRLIKTLYACLRRHHVHGMDRCLPALTSGWIKNAGSDGQSNDQTLKGQTCIYKPVPVSHYCCRTRLWPLVIHDNKVIGDISTTITAAVHANGLSNSWRTTWYYFVTAFGNSDS